MGVFGRGAPTHSRCRWTSPFDPSSTIIRLPQRAPTALLTPQGTILTKAALSFPAPLARATRLPNRSNLQVLSEDPPDSVQPDFLSRCRSATESLNSLEWDRWGIRRGMAAMATALLLLGCGKGTPTTGTFSAECRPTQLVSGGEQEIELALTVHYRLPANPKTAVTLAYGVQVNAPLGWRLTPDQWDFSHTLNTSDIGFNETRKLALSVPVGATQGQHSLQLAISPASGPAQSVDLALNVVGPR